MLKHMTQAHKHQHISTRMVHQHHQQTCIRMRYMRMLPFKHKHIAVPQLSDAEQTSETCWDG